MCSESCADFLRGCDTFSDEVKAETNQLYILPLQYSRLVFNIAASIKATNTGFPSTVV